MVVPEPPRRLHPGTIALRVLRSAPSTLLGLPALFAFMSGRGLFWALPILAIIVAISAGFSLLRWWVFRYQITADELVITDGLLSRSRRSIPLERIQDVSIERKPLQRLFGLATVKLETGGGEAEEGSLDSVGMAEAERLRATLRGGGRSTLVEAGEAAAFVEPVDAALFAMATGRVLTLGLFRFSLVWLAAIFALFQTANQFLNLDYDTLVDAARESEQALAAQFSVGLVGVILIGAGAVGILSGLVTTLLREHGFRLTLTDGRMRRVRGLTTRTEVVIAVRRIQLGLIEARWLRRRFGWRALKVQTLGGSNDPSGHQDLAPLATDAEIAPILAATGLPTFGTLPLRSVASAHAVRMLVKSVPLPLIAIVAAAVFLPIFWLGLLLMPLPVAIALLQRRHHRYAEGERALMVARGVLTTRHWIVPYRSIQTVSLHQTPLQRLLGIASVGIDTAGARGGHRPQVADLAVADAVALARALLDRAEQRLV